MIPIIFICLFFVVVAIVIIFYGCYSVYKLMNDVDDRENVNYPEKTKKDVQK